MSDLLQTSHQLGRLCASEGRPVDQAVAHALDLYAGLPPAVRDQLASMQRELTQDERRRVYAALLEALNNEENANQELLL